MPPKGQRGGGSGGGGGPGGGGGGAGAGGGGGAAGGGRGGGKGKKKGGRGGGGEAGSGPPVVQPPLPAGVAAGPPPPLPQTAQAAAPRPFRPPMGNPAPPGIPAALLFGQVPPPSAQVQQGMAGLQIRNPAPAVPPPGAAAAPGLSAPQPRPQPQPAAGPGVAPELGYTRGPTGQSQLIIRIPQRPDMGKKGDKIQVVANHFRMSMKNMETTSIYQYDVAISPEVPNKGVRRAIMDQGMPEHHSDFGASAPQFYFAVFDGSKIMYSLLRFPLPEIKFDVVLQDREGRGGSSTRGSSEGSSDRERRFKVVVKEAATHPVLSLVSFLRGTNRDCPQEIIQALDVALRWHPLRLGLVPSGRSFYSDEGLFCAQDLGGGLDVWRGFFQSVRPTQQGLVLNVDMANTAFIKPQSLMKYVCEATGKRVEGSMTLNPREAAKAKKLCRGLRVTVNHRQTARRYRIAKVSDETAAGYKFDVEGVSMSVAEYFLKTYKYRVLYPHMPCVTVGTKNSLLPIEVCDIVKGQKFNGKLDDKQTTNMLRSAAKKPHERRPDIENTVLRNAYDSDPSAAAFGLTFSTQMTALEARVLTAPTLHYKPGPQGGPTRVVAKEGAWNLLTGAKMVDGKPVHNWTVVNFSGPRCNNAMGPFAQALRKRSHEVGVPMDDPFPEFPSAYLNDFQRTLEGLAGRCKAKGKELHMLIVILGGKEALYGDIKRICETQLDVRTQCVLSKNVNKTLEDQKWGSQFLANLLLKINVKVGGQNWRLEQQSTPQVCIPFVSTDATILFGADVSHPPPGADGAASLAAVVANGDFPFSNKYTAVLRSQQSRQEMIENLGEMFRELLLRFYKCNNRKPQRIVFFRDGVSEGQFYQVLSKELDLMRRACSQMDSAYRPLFTLVVVQKRHHTRLFPADRRFADRSGNVPAGTCVDNVICHPTEFDFYLNSHAGLQGTSRPTHYHVLHDDNRFTADILQQLIYSLCYTYARCTRSVSLVPPAYYADLAASRARWYVPESSSPSVSAAGSRGGRSDVKADVLPEVKALVKEGMYFC